MRVLVICKNERDSIKNEFARVATKVSHYKSMGFFLIRSKAAYSAALGPICPKFKLCPDFIIVLKTERMKKIRSKMKALGLPQENMLIFFALMGR